MKKIKTEIFKGRMGNAENWDFGLGNDFFGFDSKSKDNKSKSKQVKLCQAKNK